MTVPKAGSIKQRKLSRHKEKDKGNNKPDEDDCSESETKKDEDSKSGGALPKLKSIRIWSRAVMMAGAVVVALMSQSNDRVLSSRKDTVDHRKQHVDCSPSYLQEINHYQGCVPLKCGRGVMDRLMLERETEGLMDMTLRAMSLAQGSSGGASTLDLHSGSLSHGQHVVNIHTFNITSILTPTDFHLYKNVKNKIIEGLAHSFGLSVSSIFLTYPTYFSRLTSDPPITPHNEYWHTHVGKELYDPFHYSCMLFLNDYGLDFKGGRFAFIESDNTTVYVEPKKGRVLLFTSGSENRHYVEKVKSGFRYAINLSFTCDRSKAVSDPTYHQQTPASADSN